MFAAAHASIPNSLVPDVSHPDGGSLWTSRYDGQGGYECSSRAYTHWENPDYLHEHPNYFSRYMDDHRDRVNEDAHVYYWDGMKWPHMYEISSRLGDATKMGWTREGIWSRYPKGQEPRSAKIANVPPLSGWTKGECTIEYDRRCGINEVQTIALSVNVGIDNSSDFKMGGTFRVLFDGFSSVPIAPSTNAHEFKAILEDLPSVGTVSVTRAEYDIAQNMISSRNDIDGCNVGMKCGVVEWKVTFVTNFGNVPQLLVSADTWNGYTYGTKAIACDDNKRIVCSLEGGHMAGLPQVYTGPPTAVMTSTENDGSTMFRKMLDSRTLRVGRPVVDTDDSFRARVTHTDERTAAVGRWMPLGGECIDMVMRGCLNNGTCVAPGTCQCAPGWSGSNCMVPLCDQTCANNGNCTLPNTCTCEKGWAGHDCTYALCAQECNNGGKCTEPDFCSCAKWANTWRDAREAGGRPLFRMPNGDPQMTGWTGFDCATPICVQAEDFVLNTQEGIVRLGGHSEVLYGDEPRNNLIRMPDGTLERQPPPPPYTSSKTLLPGDGEYTRNNGLSFQSGCNAPLPLETVCRDRIAGKCQNTGHKVRKTCSYYLYLQQTLTQCLS
jgi:hypothetical protein